MRLMEKADIDPRGSVNAEEVGQTGRSKMIDSLNYIKKDFEFPAVSDWEPADLLKFR